jgi:membrane protein DedA with SNARE-associated domain
LHAEREAKIEQMIRRHEMKVIFLSRFMVGVRAPVFLAAGVLRIPFHRFFLVDAVCATAVVGTFFWLSYAYGDRLTGLIRQSEIWLTVLVAAAACAALGFYFWRRRRRREVVTVERSESEREACAVGAAEEKEL